MKLITDDFSEILGAFGDHLDLTNAPPNPGGATIIFQTNTGSGSGEDCDKKRKGGWVTAALELAGALAVGAAAVATGGLAGIAAGLGAAAASAKAGKDAAETENQHKKCKEQPN
ncbi:hypothetical protein G6321_00045790 [Bradyrhizobium barranii subsp. barranii]|uniref:Uncharacterized protein n=1 Tax=Bradyrhizobium barranii subsp. barranii TaxID=2823807 RepID=A0A7Z0QCR9_9BRAD|nr:hypothetical protein [Bradyrhizobium barranii]UGX92871.1 hypothetical protein G6321_00045790 [Bradyrhizobium barranii subsp. barranii]